ncbi:MAG: hypothetical protein HY321_10630 [Armatimonadetes bacterium]|nr:hypothetical protein [Armatimonadota bacterium]
MTLDQIRLAGLDALARELGPVGMVRFLQQFETGRGDYSAERHEWLSGRTVREFVSELRRQRPASGAVQGRNSVSDASP